ncbi:PD40 domain-containing protein [Pseudoalteromonas sp. MMG013]|uniref:winged helix-turn-helix domain-containing protein n=1 Tax=Pseudoalteromonas sp. MMG013 TaxID=2822687 RepID=UPI001B3838DE|nr:winged helix-turn-helix domain-containing protein [Pseudoalteromonas sp. MMG013]MBQ4864269.1 PD40 domain-containing protein [Pseudoalteromonas sp. MMG013]
MQQNRPKKLLINDVELDVVGLRVKVAEQWRTIEVKQLALLQLLLDNEGKTVSRDTIITTLWPDIIVSDNSVSQLVVQLRKTLGDDKSRPQFIKTVPRVGYQLIAAVNDVPDIASKLIRAQENRPIYWLLGGLLFGAVGYKVTGALLTTSAQTIDYKYQSRLTASPGAEVYLRYSPDGRYLAFSHVGNNQEQFDLSVIDMKTQSLHNLKSTGYSEEAPVWSADGKWLAYYRYDPFSCTVRVFSVDSTIEMWRLSPETTLFECDPAQGPNPLFWPKETAIYAQQWRDDDVKITHYHIESENSFIITKETEYSDSQGMLHDVNPNNQMLLFSHAKQGKNQLLSKSEFHGDLNKRLLSADAKGPVVWGREGGTYWTGDDSLSLSDIAGKSQKIHTPNGVITDIAVDFNHGHVAHSEGISQVNLYHLDKSNESNSSDLIAISSAAKLDILAEVSHDGHWFAFASYDQQIKSQRAQVEIWVKHRQRPTASLLALLPSQVFPKQLLFSPKGNNLLIVSNRGDTYLINLFSKKLVTIIQDYNKTRNMVWSADGQSINYQARHSEGTWQLWQYSLNETTNRLLSKDVQSMDVDELALASKNQSFTGFLDDATSYLLKYTAQDIDPNQLRASLRLYQPALFEKGIYYVLRQGHQLYLYCYYTDRQENVRVRALGTYLYDINVPLSLSTDWRGEHILINKVDGIETDIVLHHFTPKTQ